MTSIFRLVALSLTVLVGACASYSTSELENPLTLADFEEVQRIEDAFLSDPDVLTNLNDINTYSTEVEVLWDTQSMRLGPLGSALISKYPGNLAGHLLLSRFYTSLEEAEAMHHQTWASKLFNYSSHKRDGSYERPFRVLTISDAYATLSHLGKEVIGASYGQTDTYPIVAYLLATHDGAIVKPYYFEIRAYEKLKELTEKPDQAQPIDVIQALAQNQDNAAAVAYGTHLLENSNQNEQQRQRTAQTGQRWLAAASRSGNALPSYYLASYAIANRDEGISWARVRSFLDRSIKLGLTDANVTLAKLNLAGVFGEDNRGVGIDQLIEAAERQSVEAATTLGSIFIEDQPDRAFSYLRQAAELGKPQHKLDYIRAILGTTTTSHLDETAFDWVNELASQENQDAMLLLARIHAKGHYENQSSLRKARKWYRRSVELAPDHGETVNEVAWVFATSNIKRLRNPGLAIKYMDELMSVNPQARQWPAYIDTWAAAYASNGDFQRAIELQKEALSIAANSPRSDITDILRSHLKDFEANKALTEEVP